MLMSPYLSCIGYKCCSTEFISSLNCLYYLNSETCAF